MSYSGSTFDVYSSATVPLFRSLEPYAKSKTVTILGVAANADLEKGTVLGKIAATGKYTIVNDANTADEGDVASAILAEDIDAGSADKLAVIYLAGDFNSNALTFGGDDTLADHEDELRDKNIYAGPSIAADGTY